MAWKVIGVIEGRSGSATVLPEWAVGSPNSFADHGTANTVREAMSHAVAKEKSIIRYLVVPSIDDALVRQVHGHGPDPAAEPPKPTLSFGKPPAHPPA